VHQFRVTEDALISNILLGVSIVIGILASLDLLLDENQKTQIANMVLHVWLWLDRLKRKSPINWLRQHHAARWFAGPAFMLGTLYMWPVLARNAVFGVIVLTAGSVLGLVIVYVTLNAASIRGTLLRIALFSFLLMLSIQGISIAFDSTFDHSGLQSSLDAALIGFVLEFVLWIVLLFWISVLSPFVLVYIAMAVLLVMEFVVRRIAEYPKGPILAASGLFASILVIIKAFG
jgi:hypothetical protein